MNLDLIEIDLIQFWTFWTFFGHFYLNYRAILFSVHQFQICICNFGQNIAVLLIKKYKCYFRRFSAKVSSMQTICFTSFASYYNLFDLFDSGTFTMFEMLNERKCF